MVAMCYYCDTFCVMHCPIMLLWCYYCAPDGGDVLIACYVRVMIVILCDYCVIIGLCWL